MLESKFRSKLIDELEVEYPGCIILHNDPNDIQGIPDLTILYKKRWAALETKKAKKSSKQPNQSYYVDRMNEMSYAAFICPENKQEVLDELQRSLSPKRRTRVSKSK